jgi:4-hydroxymandelate oxidase
MDTPEAKQPHDALRSVFSPADFEIQAARRLDCGVMSYLSGGATDEITLAENVEAFRRVRVRPRILAGVGEVDPRTTLLGRPVSMPLGLSPAGANGFFHPEAEVAVARAARRAGVMHALSTVSTRSLEEVAEVGAPRWFQLYLHRDRGVSRALLERAVAAGYGALVVTADMPVIGRRERELRVGFVFSGHYGGNLSALGDAESLLDGIANAGLTWQDLDWLRSQTDLPIVLKGVMCGADAALAVEHGASAVLVSNHGARLLDRTPATLDVLGEVARAVGGRAEVYLDGGVRRGLDAAIAIALGARAVFVGRPFLSALALAGDAGVSHLLGLFRDELVEAMALLGARTPADIGPALIASDGRARA